MAWPPPVLPVDRTDLTPIDDTHAADHNAANLGINDLTTRVSGHEQHQGYVGDIGYSFGAGVATTLAPGAGPLRIPSAGIWFVSWAVDVAGNGSTGWGYLDTYVSGISDSTPYGLLFFRSRTYENTLRFDSSGWSICQLPGGGGDLYVRLNTYSGSVPYNSGIMLAYQMQAL